MRVKWPREQWGGVSTGRLIKVILFHIQCNASYDKSSRVFFNARYLSFGLYRWKLVIVKRKRSRRL